MNQRFKGLLLEAKCKARDEVKKQLPPGYAIHDSELQSLNITYEMFAELIIRECAAECDRLEDNGVWHGVGSEHGTGTVASAADCSFYIKKHFGVDE